MNNKEVEKAYNRAYGQQKGVKQKTFVFKMKDMEGSKEHPNGLGNDILDEFCQLHNVMSIVFADKGDKFAYFLVYR